MKRWFAKHPNYHLHFTPTSASWLNQVERFFAEITNQRIRRGTFSSVRQLEQAIQDYLAVTIKIANHLSGLPMPILSSAKSVISAKRTYNSGPLDNDDNKNSLHLVVVR